LPTQAKTIEFLVCFYIAKHGLTARDGVNADNAEAIICLPPTYDDYTLISLSRCQHDASPDWYNLFCVAERA